MAEEGESFIAKIAAKVGGKKKLILILVAALIVLAAGGLALSVLSRRTSAETAQRRRRKIELPEGADYQNLTLDQLKDILANVASSYPSAETPGNEAGFTHPIIQDIVVTEDGQPVPSGQVPPEGDVVIDPSQPEGNPPTGEEEEEPVEDEEPGEEEEPKESEEGEEGETPEDMCTEQEKTIGASDKCGNSVGYSDPGPAGGDSHCQTQDCCSWYQTYHVHDLQKVYAKGDLIVRYAPGSSSGCTDTVTVEVSADDATWSTVGTFSTTATVGSGSEPSGYWKTYMQKIHDVKNFRYIKVTIPRCYNDYSDAFVCGGTEAEEEEIEEEEEKTPEQLCEEQEKAILYTEECNNDQGYSDPGPAGGDSHCQTKDCCNWYQKSHVHDLVLAYSDVDLAVEYTPGFSNGCTDTVTVETSRDNVNWTTAKTFSTESVNTCPDEGECWKTYTRKIHNVKNVRYVKVTIPECYNDYSAVHVCVPGPIIYYSGYVREGESFEEALNSLYAIKDVVEKYYPVVKELYGPLYNFAQRHIRIQYDRDASPSYLPQYDLLVVNGDEPWDVVPGLVGIFHGEYASVVPETWEFGMRYAVAELAVRRFPEDFDSDYGQFMDWVINFSRHSYEKYNVGDYPIWGANIFYAGDMLDEWTRLSLAHIAMMKPYLYDNQVFVKLNEKLYEIPLNSYLYDGEYGWESYGIEGGWFNWALHIYDDDYLLFNNVVSAFPDIEGLTPKQWYARQHVLHQTETDYLARDSMVDDGQVLVAQPNSLRIYAFKSGVTEDGMKFVGRPGLPVKITVENDEGETVKEEDHTTDGDGKLGFPFLNNLGMEQERRYLVKVECAGQTPQAHVYDEAWVGWGYTLQGVVTNFGKGKIKALDADQNVLEEADITYGAFDFSERFSGVIKLEVTDIDGDKVLEKELAKDRGGYFVVLNSPTPSYSVGCTDTDGGIDYYTKGVISEDGEVQTADSCLRGFWVEEKEWWEYDEVGSCPANADYPAGDKEDRCVMVEHECVSEGGYMGHHHPCILGCEDGACLILPDGFTNSWVEYKHEPFGIKLKAPSSWGLDQGYTLEGTSLTRMALVSNTDPLALADPAAKVSRFDVIASDHDLKTDSDYSNWFAQEAWPSGSESMTFKGISAEKHVAIIDVPRGPLNEGETYPYYKEMYYVERDGNYYLIQVGVYVTADVEAENLKVLVGLLESFEFL